MIEPQRLQELIEETLQASRIANSGCLVSNVASQELRQCGSTAMQAIEEAIRHRVLPDSWACADHNALLRKYPGLMDLWVAYFSIGRCDQVERMAQFLRSLDG